MPLLHQDGFCTAVRLYLEVNGQVLNVAQVGDESLILRDAITLDAPAQAEVVVSVDGKQRKYPVMLGDGIKDRTVFFQRIQTPAAG